MIRRLLNGQINSITLAAALVAFSSLASRLLGIFRDRILAGEFGAGDTLDVYYAAFRIPDLVFNLLVLGALSAGFIPIFTGLISDWREKAVDFFQGSHQHKAWLLANNILNILIVGLIILCGLGIIFAPQLIKLITPGFSGEKLQLTIGLSRIMFLSPFFLGISAVLGGILQSFKRFFVYSLSPIFYNIGIIIGALYLVPLYGIYGLAWGVVLGSFLHMVIQFPLVFKLGFRFKAVFNVLDHETRKIGLMMVPRTMSLAIGQINLLVITIIASTLSSGSLSIFNFANNLQTFPIGIFGISFAVACFPALSAMAFNKKELVSNLSLTIRQILFFIIPSTILLLSLRAQIIRVILGTGQFDWNDTILTINTLGFFALSLFAQSLLPVLTRVFYARHDSKTPFIVGFFMAIINVFLSFWLAGFLGVAGLALAFSITSIINYFILWLWLHLEIGQLDELNILFSALKFCAAAAAAGATIQLTKLVVWPFVDMTRVWGVLVQGSAAGLAGILVYLLVCWLLGSQELYGFWKSFKRRLSWKKLKTDDQAEARGI